MLLQNKIHANIVWCLKTIRKKEREKERDDSKVNDILRKKVA